MAMPRHRADDEHALACRLALADRLAELRDAVRVLRCASLG
jgi:hypothetical protein